MKNEEINTKKKRSAIYVDGFNLYHPINDIGKPHLKWLNLWRMGELIIKSQSEDLVLIKYYSALRPNVNGSHERHNKYVNALRTVGVECIMGHYMREPFKCNDCLAEYERNVEKQTDINMALGAVLDAYDDLYDHAYLITSDSDHASTFRNLKQRFPQKTFTCVSPPNRSHSRIIQEFASAKLSLNESHLEKCLFPSALPSTKGFIRRPSEYDPPK